MECSVWMSGIHSWDECEHELSETLGPNGWTVYVATQIAFGSAVVLMSLVAHVVRDKSRKSWLRNYVLAAASFGATFQLLWGILQAIRVTSVWAEICFGARLVGWSFCYTSFAYFWHKLLNAFSLTSLLSKATLKLAYVGGFLTFVVGSISLSVTLIIYYKFETKMTFQLWNLFGYLCFGALFHWLGWKHHVTSNTLLQKHHSNRALLQKLARVHFFVGTTLCLQVVGHLIYVSVNGSSDMWIWWTLTLSLRFLESLGVCGLVSAFIKSGMLLATLSATFSPRTNLKVFEDHSASLKRDGQVSPSSHSPTSPISHNQNAPTESAKSAGASDHC